MKSQLKMSYLLLVMISLFVSSQSGWSSYVLVAEKKENLNLSNLKGHWLSQCENQSPRLSSMRTELKVKKK